MAEEVSREHYDVRGTSKWQYSDRQYLALKRERGEDVDNDRGGQADTVWRLSLSFSKRFWFVVIAAIQSTLPLCTHIQ